VKIFGLLYPSPESSESINVKNMTFNLHSYLHFSKQVKDFGPLNENCCFAFEGCFKVIKSWIGGFKGIPNQMKQFIKVKSLLDLDFKPSINNLLDIKMKDFLNKRIKEMNIIDSKGSNITFAELEDKYPDLSIAILNKNIFIESCDMFERVNHKNKTYRNRNDKYQDCIVKIGDKFGYIDHIISTQGTIYLYINLISVLDTKKPRIADDERSFQRKFVAHFQKYFLIGQQNISMDFQLVNINEIEKCIGMINNNYISISIAGHDDHD
jgi:hypothetical protein